MASRQELINAVQALQTALEEAPHKHRIDFDPYWVWYDGARAEALRNAETALLFTEEVKK